MAGVFTQNRFCAAPVQVCREHLAAIAGPIRALVVNTGNANAGTGERRPGARHMPPARAVATLLGCSARADAAVFDRRDHGALAGRSHRWPACPQAIADLAPDNWSSAAEAIMTTDTLPKAASRRV